MESSGLESQQIPETNQEHDSKLNSDTSFSQQEDDDLL